MSTWMKWKLLLVCFTLTLIGFSGSTGRYDAAIARLDPPAYVSPAIVPPAVAFMRKFIGRVNPSIVVEDARCADGLPAAIYTSSARYDVDWQTLFVLAWQESYFDCHAKNRRDLGGAYGPFQIRRLWEPLVGDPREDYFDPYLSTERAAKVLAYYQETDRLRILANRRFSYPLLCLYNTGETRRVNMKYCRTVSNKMRILAKEWKAFANEIMLASRESYQ